MLEAFEVVARTGKRISLHAETNSIMERRQARLVAAGRQDPFAHLASRPAVVAVETVSRAAVLAEWTGARIHILHISSAEELRPLREAKARGVDITGETCPHYLLLSTDDYHALGGGTIRVNPPVREARNQKALWSALADGTIDLIATDHAPPSPDRDPPRVDHLPASGDCQAETAMGNRTISVDVVRIPTKGPGDVCGLMQLIEAGAVDPADIVAVLGKTEGNGGVNDFTREYALAALCQALAPQLKLPPRAVEDKIAFVMSGGTEGVLSPHLTIFSRQKTQDGSRDQAHRAGNKRLSIGIAHTREFLPEDIGRRAQIEQTVKAVHAAMGDAGIDDARDVHFVQVKCPLLTSGRIAAALGRGHKTVTTGTYGSMGYSRGASALGVARALGEIDGDVDEDRVLKDWSLFSAVASASAGIELMHNVVIVMGNSARSTSPFVIGHAVMRDAIDLAAVLAALDSVDLVSPMQRCSTGWSMFLPRQKPRRMAACAAFATRCSMTPTSARRVMLAPRSAG